jgi:uncharacterized membrane protein (TIGR02234 family)
MTAAARLQSATAMAGLLVGGGALALLAGGRGWQTVTAVRTRPLTGEVLSVTGRTLHPAVTALAVVALAGIVGVLATRGRARRVIGGVLVVVGGVLVWQSLTGLAAMTTAHAHSVLRDARGGVGLDTVVALRVVVHPTWPVLAAVGGVLVAVAGVLTLVWGARWSGLSRRYESPQPASTDAGMWTALDGGLDPTADPAPDPSARTEP